MEKDEREEDYVTKFANQYCDGDTEQALKQKIVQIVLSETDESISGR